MFETSEPYDPQPPEDIYWQHEMADEPKCEDEGCEDIGADPELPEVLWATEVALVGVEIEQEDGDVQF